LIGHHCIYDEVMSTALSVNNAEKHISEVSEK
jgi:hypothetical protein